VTQTQVVVRQVHKNHFQTHSKVLRKNPGRVMASFAKLTTVETRIPSTTATPPHFIPIKIDWPSSSGAFPNALPIILFIHGGRFHMGDHHSHSSIAESLASLNNNVVRVDFRCGSSAPTVPNSHFKICRMSFTTFKTPLPTLNWALWGRPLAGFSH